MKKRFSAGTVLALMLLVATLTYLVSVYLVREDYNRMLERSKYESDAAAKYLEAKELIEGNFIGEINPDRLVDGAIDGMVTATGDRWSYYLNAEDYKRQQEAKESFVGIGVSVARYGDDLIRITQVFDGSPAKEAGIEPMDMVFRVDGALVEELGYETAVQGVRGDEYTFVELGLRRRDGSEYTARVQRRKVHVMNLISELVNGSVGYVRVNAFSARVDEEFAVAVDNLVAAGAKALIFDMRFNPGGELRALKAMLDKILPKDAVIIITRTKEGVEEAPRSDEIRVELPMAVLVNADSYSAAEYFAACLQEYGLAEVVGEKTVGKGYAQYPLRLSDESYIYLSMETYYTPNGVSLAGVGITPDHEVVLDDVMGFYNPDHEGDAQFMKALNVMTAKIEG